MSRSWFSSGGVCVRVCVCDGEVVVGFVEFQGSSFTGQLSMSRALLPDRAQVTWLVLVATASIIVGCLLLVLFGNHSSETYDVEDLLELYRQWVQGGGARAARLHGSCAFVSNETGREGGEGMGAPGPDCSLFPTCCTWLYPAAPCPVQSLTPRPSSLSCAHLVHRPASRTPVPSRAGLSSVSYCNSRDTRPAPPCAGPSI